MILRLREAAFVILGPVSIYLLVALVSYDPADPGWSHSGQQADVRNDGGVAGAWIADIGLLLFGYFAFMFPVMLAYWGWLVLRGEKGHHPTGLEALIRLSGFVLTLGAGAAIASAQDVDRKHGRLAAGVGNLRDVPVEIRRLDEFARLAQQP